MAKNNSYRFSLQAIIIAAIVSALVAGTAVYIWHQRELKTALAPYQKTDEEQIIEAAKNYAAASVFTGASTTYQLHERKGDFAQVSIASSGGGYVAMLKKANTEWVVIFTGQNLPPKDIGERFGLPDGWHQQ
jgi:hypothetical protein